MKSYLTKYSVFVFDLDDTIYPEIEYLKKAYYHVAETVVNKERLNKGETKKIAFFLLETFQKGGRNLLFQKLNEEYSLKLFILDDFLNCLRNTPLDTNSLNTYKGIQTVFESLVANKKKIFILTNGNPEQQKNKIQSVDIPFKERITVKYASETGLDLQKPNPYYLNIIISDTGITPRELLFVGDSVIDQQTAFNAGVDFVNVCEFISLAAS